MKNKVAQRVYQAQWYRDRYRSDPEFAKAQKMIATKRYHSVQRDQQLKRKYGITLADYNVMLEAQENKCAVCRQHSHRARTLDVDHDHVTGRVRGLLCSHCNRVVIASVERIGVERIAKYLGGE